MPKTRRLITGSLGALALSVAGAMFVAPPVGAAEDGDLGTGPTEEACTDIPELQHFFDPADASGWVRHTGAMPLCSPVYVHPTTWGFVNTAQGESIWPQDLLGSETVAVALDGSETFFRAPGLLECAQADIYYTGSNPNVSLPDRLLAPGHPHEPPQLYWESDGTRPTWAIYGGTTGEDGLITKDCGDAGAVDPEASAVLSNYECGPDVMVNLSTEGGSVDFVLTANGEVVASPTVDGSQAIDIQIDSGTRIIVEGPVGEVLLDAVVVYEPCVLGGEEEVPPAEEEPVVDTPVAEDDDGSAVGGVVAQPPSRGQAAGASTLPMTGAAADQFILLAATAMGLGAALRMMSRRLAA